MKKVKPLHLTLGLAISLMGGYLLARTVHHYHVEQLFDARLIPYRFHGTINEEWANNSNLTTLKVFRLYSKQKGTPHFEEFVPYLEGENPQIVEDVVRIIGRSENPHALGALSKLQNSLKAKPFSDLEKKGISHFIAFSMARIQYREWKGIQRINKTLGAVGLNFSDMVQQSRIISAPSMGGLGWASLGGRTVRELLQMFYSMEKKGERNEYWYRQITARNDYFLMIQSAQRPQKEGILFLLDCIAHLKMPGEYLIPFNHLLTMKEEVPSELRKELEYVNSHRKEFPRAASCELLFSLALWMDDKGSIPIIEKFQDHKYKSVRDYSKNTVKLLRGKKGTKDISLVCMDFD